MNGNINACEVSKVMESRIPNLTCKTHGAVSGCCSVLETPRQFPGVRLQFSSPEPVPPCPDLLQLSTEAIEHFPQGSKEGEGAAVSTHPLAWATHIQNCTCGMTLISDHAAKRQERR
jgi:hypothetical protein